MTKKEYIKPAVEIVKLQQQNMILAGSYNAYGMQEELQGDEVEDAW